MLVKPTYFSLDEFVCEDIYNHFGDVAWQFFDARLLITLDILRQKFNKPIYINNWQVHGEFDERGYRCLQCSLVKKAIEEKRLYVSPHMTGQGADFDVLGLLAEEVRQWIIKNQNLLPYPVRLEAGVGWVHLDTRDNFEGKKVVLFNA
jgi:hypothetical protein